MWSHREELHGHCSLSKASVASKFYLEMLARNLKKGTGRQWEGHNEYHLSNTGD